jgi:transmembrane sensor
MSNEAKGRSTSLCRIGAGKDAPNSPALDWVEPSGAIDLLYDELDARLRRRKRKGIAASAACCALLLASTLALRQWTPTNSHALAPISPIVSSPPRQVLTDGSTVDLNGNAEITAEFSAVVRRVVLSHGEAHFQVVKDNTRPFLVVAAGVEVRAVGTTFSVQLGPTSVDVLVTEGRVAIGTPPAVANAGAAAAGAALPKPTYVDAGSRAVVEIGRTSAHVTAVQPLTTAEATERLAWRAPRVEFTMTPLGEAVAVFLQHAGVRMRFEDPEMARLELSGFVRADNVDSLLHLLAAEFQIRAEHRDDEILLRR